LLESAGLVMGLFAAGWVWPGLGEYTSGLPHIVPMVY